MCHGGEWKTLYNQCKLNELKEVHDIKTQVQVDNWCAIHAGPFKSEKRKEDNNQKKLYNEAFTCLKKNRNECHWNNYEGSGWSPLYEKCKLNNIPEVNKIAGSAQIGKWCELNA